jgi:hypothetical protein
VLGNHSITSSAAASNEGETSRPSAFAVFRLITSWNLIGCMAGRSKGFSPLRIRPTKRPVCRYESGRLRSSSARRPRRIREKGRSWLSHIAQRVPPSCHAGWRRTVRPAPPARQRPLFPRKRKLRPGPVPCWPGLRNAVPNWKLTNINCAVSHT